MNIDLDSYLYIIITIVILIITALGRKKKKPAQQVTGKPAGQPVEAESQPVQDKPSAGAEKEEVSSDPFERLEQLFVPKPETVTMKEEEPETVKPKMDPNAEARRLREMEDKRERRHREELEEERAESFRKHMHGDLITGLQDSEEEISVLTLFDDPDDIKRGIIYSEIFGTKYF